MSSSPYPWEITVENEAAVRAFSSTDFGDINPFPPPDITLRLTRKGDLWPALEVQHATEINSRPQLLKQFSADLSAAPKLEAIVRALAESNPAVDIGCEHTDRIYVCWFCPEDEDMPEYSEPVIPLEDHTEACPWRQAVEWTQQQ